MAVFGGFDGLRKAMRQHGNIDYANIWDKRLYAECLGTLAIY